MNYIIPYTCVSHIGRCRHSNQDNFICDGRYMGIRTGSAAAEAYATASGLSERVTAKSRPSCDMESCEISGTLFSERPAMLGIFDGMGGEECGETASLLAAREAAGSMLGDDPEEGLRGLCLRANERICKFAERNGVLSTGTTAALLAFDPNGIALCNIGDSRIFRFSDWNLEQISVDHVIKTAPGRKPPLSQNLGIPPTEMLIEPYTRKTEYRNGDIYLICSDGLTDMVPEEEIAESLASVGADIHGSARGTIMGSLKVAEQRLLDRALANGGRDNITMILCIITP